MVGASLHSDTNNPPDEELMFLPERPLLLLLTLRPPNGNHQLYLRIYRCPGQKRLCWFPVLTASVLTVHSDVPVLQSWSVQSVWLLTEAAPVFPFQPAYVRARNR